MSKLNFSLLPGAIETAKAEKDVTMMKQIKAAIQAYIDAPETVLKKQIQAFGVSTDLQRVATAAYSVILQNDNFDMAYERVFDPVTIPEGEDSFEIHDITSGLIVRKVKEGERLDVQKISGVKQTVYAEKHGGALGWTDEMIRFRKIPAMQFNARVFRNKFWRDKAQVHYALLLAAIAGNTTPWQGGVGPLVRDIQTLSAGAYHIANVCQNKYPNTAEAQYIGFFHPSLKQRITAAIQTTVNTVSNIASVGTILLWNIQPVYSWFIPANTGIIVLPGNMLQRADIMGMTSMEDNDILQLTYIQAIWAYYAAVIGDTEQIRGVLFA